MTLASTPSPTPTPTPTPTPNQVSAADITALCRTFEPPAGYLPRTLATSPPLAAAGGRPASAGYHPSSAASAGYHPSSAASAGYHPSSARTKATAGYVRGGAAGGGGADGGSGGGAAGGHVSGCNPGGGNAGHIISADGWGDAPGGKTRDALQGDGSGERMNPYGERTDPNPKPQPKANPKSNPSHNLNLTLTLTLTRRADGPRVPGASRTAREATPQPIESRHGTGARQGPGTERSQRPLVTSPRERRRPLVTTPRDGRRRAERGAGRVPARGISPLYLPYISPISPLALDEFLLAVP